jgi:hypothetical protein
MTALALLVPFGLRALLPVLEAALGSNWDGNFEFVSIVMAAAAGFVFVAIEFGPMQRAAIAIVYFPLMLYLLMPRLD